MRLLTYLPIMTLQILMPCFNGSELSISSEKLLTTLFSSNWVGQSKDFKLALKIFMENSKKPMKVSAFHIFELGLENFLKIINSAFSLYAVLKNIKN